jgi:uncharacterized integral membrane protein
MTSQPAGGTQPAAPGTAAPANPARAHPAPVHHAVRRTRIGGIWVAAALFAVVLLLPLIFTLENSHSVSIGYFGAHGLLPLGVALLLAAVLGVLLAVIPGTARIIQLGITARRHRRHDTKPPASPPATPPAGHDHNPAPADPASLPACKAKTRSIEALDQHIGLGMRQRLLPCWHAQ